MAEIRHINEEEYAAKALELLGDEKDGFIRFALNNLSAGTSSGDVRERLVKKVKSDMEDVLFHYLKRSGKVRGDYRYDYTLGYPRRKYIEPRMWDVPSRLLDITVILKNFQEEIDSIMTEAGKLKTVADIEAATKDALEKEDQ